MEIKYKRVLHVLHLMQCVYQSVCLSADEEYCRLIGTWVKGNWRVLMLQTVGIRLSSGVWQTVALHCNHETGDNLSACLTACLSSPYFQAFPSHPLLCRPASSPHSITQSDSLCVCSDPPGASTRSRLGHTLKSSRTDTDKHVHTQHI